MPTHKIAHLTSVHTRYDTRIFLKECTSLAAHGYLTSLIVADGQGDEQKNNVNIYDVGASKNRLDRISRAPLRVLKKAIELDADIYHLHDPELIPIGLKLKKLEKTVIFDSHEDVPNQILSKYYLNPFIRRPISELIRRYEIFACSKLDAVIAATPFIEEKFLKINPNTVNVNNYPIIKEFASITHSSENSHKVFYVGSITAVRGIEEIVDALNFTQNNASLLLGGSFVDNKLEEKVKKMKSWRKVQYLGFINRQQIETCLSESIAGLVVLHPIPSFLESLPVKMFEYMSAGIPVIASDFPLWKTIINENDCGICVDPLKPKAIAETIDYFIQNPSIARQMGENGRKSVESKYNWDIEKTKLFNLYNKLLARE